MWASSETADVNEGVARGRIATLVGAGPTGGGGEGVDGDGIGHCEVSWSVR